MLRDSAGYERLCWRPCPCAKCKSGLTPIGVIIGGENSDSLIRGEDPEELSAIQVGLLQSWVDQCDHQTEETLYLPKLAEGSEHKVFLSASDAMVFKVTRPQTYGESYYLVEGRVNQRNCSPLEYLVRLHLWMKLFRAAPIDLGITAEGQIVSVQKFIAGLPPDQEAVDQFLIASGLSEVKRKCWLWRKVYRDFEIWIGDARDENFVQTELGLVPIDIRVWFTTRVML